MIKDFYTYNAEQIHEVAIEFPRDKDLTQIYQDAIALTSFIKINVQEMGPLTKVDQGIWFTVTVMLGDARDATWIRLKWA